MAGYKRQITYSGSTLYPPHARPQGITTAWTQLCATMAKKNKKKQRYCCVTHLNMARLAAVYTTLCLVAQLHYTKQSVEQPFAVAGSQRIPNTAPGMLVILVLTARRNTLGQEFHGSEGYLSGKPLDMTPDRPMTLGHIISVYVLRPSTNSPIIVYRCDTWRQIRLVNNAYTASNKHGRLHHSVLIPCFLLLPLLKTNILYGRGNTSATVRVQYLLSFSCSIRHRSGTASIIRAPYLLPFRYSICYRSSTVSAAIRI